MAEVEQIIHHIFGECQQFRCIIIQVNRIEIVINGRHAMLKSHQNTSPVNTAKVILRNGWKIKKVGENRPSSPSLEP
ncbi:predicted protein [Histoplasma mississippiense (nom. inval.)]|uniref:predicted protein n=1 Tax=Ajellomyces capsulatus (strain NAm1 / WU24) TaxID=2059318 RepID=UPI000157C04D|nr:predicted protein [Histoplasma mississippiense (nom. inval.)]EDN07078.1 predicted protein [Histoplasma mississippiense (nom. inval.)]